MQRFFVTHSFQALYHVNAHAIQIVRHGSQLVVPYPCRVHPSGGGLGRTWLLPYAWMRSCARRVHVWDRKGVSWMRRNESCVQFDRRKARPRAARISQLLAVRVSIVVGILLAQFFRPAVSSFIEIDSEWIQRHASTHACCMSDTLTRASDGTTFHSFRARDATTVRDESQVRRESLYHAAERRKDQEDG